MTRPPVDIVGTFMEKPAPIDLFGLSRELGLNVVSQPLSEDISGKIECPMMGPCKITLNSNHSRTRQRFTLAHEIAHFVLHRNLIGDGITDDGLYRSDRPSSIERQANQYAADILMPWRQVRDLFKRGYTASDLSSLFDVSKAVAEIRVKELGLS